MTEMAYDPGLVDTVATTLDLRTPNRDALDTLARSLDGCSHGQVLVADLAPGVGKTYIAAGLIDYLYGVGVRNVVIVTPGSTIQRKTVANLTPGGPKFVRGLQCRPTVITLDNFEKGAVAQALEDPQQMKVFVFTVQSLLRPDTKENRRAHREHETLGQSLSGYLRDADDLVIIADEHHIYAGNATKFAEAISDLDPEAVVGLTATPDESTPAESIIYHYPLAAAIADGFVKIPVLVGSPTAVKDTRTQMADAVALLDAKVTALAAWCATTSNTFIPPVLFVVAQTIDEATALRDTLAQPDMLDGADKVLLITSKEPDTVLTQLDQLEDTASPIRAVVSVAMLKEGWDVKNIYVIASVRKMESQLLSEQVLGRGLRLPYGRRTGVGMLDTVEVLSHHSFQQLLADAEVLLSQTLGDRTADAETVTATSAGEVGTPAPATPLGGLAGVDLNSPTAQVGVFIPTSEPDPNQGSMFPTTSPGEQVGGISTVAGRLAEAAAVTEVLSHPELPTAPSGVSLPLYIPSVTWRWKRPVFSLASINTVEVEAKGQGFGKDNAPSLVRKALDATRRADGSIEQRIYDASTDAPVAAVAQRLDVDTVESDLTARLLSANAVAQTISEMNAATTVAKAFLRGAGVTEDTEWRPEHARFAASALVQWIGTKQSEAPAEQVADITLHRWPDDPTERVLTVPSTNRNKVTGTKTFVRAHPYNGWTKSIYPSAKFDSWSAEFRLAELLDASPDIKAWTRITDEVPLSVSYSTGAATRNYHPDFIVIDTSGVLWVVEGKADSEMMDPGVLAKRDAAVVWVNVVNGSTSVSQQWAYLLASETSIGNATDWTSVVASSFSHK